MAISCSFSYKRKAIRSSLLCAEQKIIIAVQFSYLTKTRYETFRNPESGYWVKYSGYSSTNQITTIGQLDHTALNFGTNDLLCCVF